MKWQKVCPACQRADYWCGSAAHDGAVWPCVPLKISAPPADGDHMHTTKLPVEWDNAIHGAAKQEADAAGMVELDVEIAWARATGEIQAPAPSPAPSARDAKRARRHTGLEERIRATFTVTGRTWVSLLMFARDSISKRAVLEAASLGIIEQHRKHYSAYRLVRP